MRMHDIKDRLKFQDKTACPYNSPFAALQCGYADGANGMAVEFSGRSRGKPRQTSNSLPRTPPKIQTSKGTEQALRIREAAPSIPSCASARQHGNGIAREASPRMCATERQMTAAAAGAASAGAAPYCGLLRRIAAYCGLLRRAGAPSAGAAYSVENSWSSLAAGATQARASYCTLLHIFAPYCAILRHIAP